MGGCIMEEKLRFKSINMVIVFETFDKDMVRKDIIKQELKNYDLEILEVPAVLVINFRKYDGQASFSNKKLIITIPVKDINYIDIVEFLSKASKILLDAAPNQNEIKAFGYNIGGNLRNPDIDYNNFLLTECYAGGEKLSELIGEEITQVSTIFSFKKDDALFNVSLIPVKEKDSFRQLNFEVNIHFESATTLALGGVKENLMSYLEYLKKMMDRL